MSQEQEIIGAAIAAGEMMLPKPPRRPLSYTYADQLPEEFTPPDELIEGVLASCSTSVIYGDSNSGKTFLAIDMAAAVARGVPWMGRCTEQGLVVYLAAESPTSVRTRLQAYQSHYGVRVNYLVIVQSPVDLYGSDDDTQALIKLIQEGELARGQKVRLIIGDTLSRVSPGANENAGQDMTRVVQRIDRIVAECEVHFCLIHHSGKDASAGARGWSGLRAAVDTEIVVTAGAAGSCAEITKQRDLGSKGERIGFALHEVVAGRTKWNKPTGSCVVIAANAPTKQKGKRTSKASAAILAILKNAPKGLTKPELVDKLKEEHDSSSVYRQLKSLIEEVGSVKEQDGRLLLTDQMQMTAK